MDNYESMHKKRDELIEKLKSKDMLSFGFVRIWYALSGKLFLMYNQEFLLESICNELKNHGICPYCLDKMVSERYCDAAGDMDDRYVCNNDKCTRSKLFGK